MMSVQDRSLKEEIISIGRRLYLAHFVTARAGNLSARIDNENVLITATGTLLSDLREEDIIKVNINSKEEIKNERLSTEFPLHREIYKNLPAETVIHCHPPLVNGYFAVYSNLKALTFEARFLLGDIPVVVQETPSVTKPELVIEALKTNNLVVIKNHGVVCVAKKFGDGFNLIETLEDAVKTLSVARLFDKTILDDLDKTLKEELIQEVGIYPMFSKEHIQAIVDLVNKDEFIATKGKELDLTVKLAIRLDETNKAHTFNFEKGKIVKLDFSAEGEISPQSGGDTDAPFIISGPAAVWEQVFLGKLDSFVAVTQGKMKLQGQLGQLSKWYVPFSRLFQLFKQVKFRRDS